MKKNEIKKRLIEISYNEIYKKGFQAASTTDILNKAKINKGSMYHYFKSKKDLALSSIDEKLRNKIINKYGRLRKDKKNSMNFLIDFLNNTKIINFKYGCPVNNLIQEMSPLDKDFKIALESLYDYMEDSVKIALDIAIKNKEISNANNTKKLSMFIISSMEGSILSAKKSNSIQNYKDSISILTCFLEGLKIKKN